MDDGQISDRSNGSTNLWRLNVGCLVVCAAFVACSSSNNHSAPKPAGSTGGATGSGSAHDAGQRGASAAASQGGGTGGGGGAGKSSGAGPTSQDAGPGKHQDAGVPTDAAVDAAPTGLVGPPPTPADYAKRGSYAMAKQLLNQGLGTVSGGSSALLPLGNGNDPSGFTLYFPDGAQSGARFPLLTFGNGTFCSPTFYDELIGFIVSYGYVVIATNTSNTGSGAEMLKAVEWALAQNDKADSPIHGMVDGDHIGAFGHSQGGAGTVAAGADPRIDAIAPLSGGSMGDAGALVQCPTFYTLTENDVVTPANFRRSYDSTPTPSVFGVTAGGDHDDYTDKADDPGIAGLTSNDGLRTRAAIVAWFEWQLKGKTALQPLFVGPNCGFCGDPNWKTFESKGF